MKCVTLSHAVAFCLAELVTCCIRVVQQVREQLTTEFSSERNSLLSEVQDTRQQQQEALAQAQKGTLICCPLRT